ncbi:hypothetical protein FISHEDRAFT_61467 [Fistulina hepatica ATCC 64428]|uniref:MADS-box domain-containing protein n=1 Tax=Fistulina hepatica ATCC 64428 TaxID=1128425 RepID=A0A0D7A3K6_9AGAR|nr:hypothetical protein FISHEDRAFT_61467 [Fistulina hepatica ATCC 64428]
MRGCNFAGGVLLSLFCALTLCEELVHQLLDRKMGRRKIEIQPIQHERNRSVTFLKSFSWQRKNGLFKKAYELGVLCSVDVAVIIFEERPGHHVKLYQYASKDVQKIVQRQLEASFVSFLGVDFSGNSTAMNDNDDEDGEDELDKAPPAKRARQDPEEPTSRPPSQQTTKGKEESSSSSKSQSKQQQTKQAGSPSPRSASASAGNASPHSKKRSPQLPAAPERQTSSGNSSAGPSTSLSASATPLAYSSSRFEPALPPLPPHGASSFSPQQQRYPHADIRYLPVVSEYGTMPLGMLSAYGRGDPATPSELAILRQRERARQETEREYVEIALARRQQQELARLRGRASSDAFLRSHHHDLPPFSSGLGGGGLGLGSSGSGSGIGNGASASLSARISMTGRNAGPGGGRGGGGNDPMLGALNASAPALATLGLDSLSDASAIPTLDWPVHGDSDGSGSGAGDSEGWLSYLSGIPPRQDDL